MGTMPCSFGEDNQTGSGTYVPYWLVYIWRERGDGSHYSRDCALLCLLAEYPNRMRAKIAWRGSEICGALV